MIIDHINNAALYYGLGAGIEAGLRFLKTVDLEHLPLGKNEIRGDKLFTVVSEYTAKDKAASKWEAHRKYIDIQYVVSGAENMGYQCVSKLEVESQYDDKNDVLFLRGPGGLLTVAEGFFVIFFPQDAHQPGLSVRRPQMVRKIVVKVLVD